MADYLTNIEVTYKTKLFYVDFVPVIAHAHRNLVYILNGKQMQTLSILKNHQQEIICLDVAPLTHKILSAEPGLVLIHQLLKPAVTDKGYYQQSLTLCKYHWILKYRIPIDLLPSLRAIPCSFIGDFFVTLYPQTFCIWVRTTEKLFENLFCCYSGNAPTVSSKKSLELFSSDINRTAEISTDGRLISVMSENSTLIQIWYNRLYQTDSDYTDFIDFSIASISLEHETTVLICKFKPQNFFETANKYIANVLIAITADYKVHLWIESFIQNSIEFVRFETILEFASEKVFPMFSFAHRNTKDQVFNCPKEDIIISKLLNPNYDRIYYLLKQHNEMGITKINYLSDTNDWLCFITETNIYVYKITGARNFPTGTPTVTQKYKVKNSLTNALKTFKISGLYDATINDDMKIFNFYGYSPEQWLGIWHKAFGSKIEIPCRLNALFFQEKGPISLSAMHTSIPLFLTVSEHNGKQLILISYELEKTFAPAGHFIEEEKIVEVHWMGYLPLIILLTESGVIKVIGPEIKPIEEDIDSFTCILSYSMNTHARYLWKYYYVKPVEGVKASGMLHAHTFHVSRTGRYKEVIFLFTNDSIVIAAIYIKNTSSQDDLEVKVKIKGSSQSLQETPKSKHLLNSPKTTNDPVKICLQGEKVIRIYTVNIKAKKIAATAEIALPKNLETIRVNNYQSPIIAIIDKEKIVRMYMDTGKYLGYISILEVYKGLEAKLNFKLKKVDLLFYHNANVQALILLLNQKMVLLCNNYRYESVLDFVVVDVLDKPVPYCLDSPIINLNQSANDSIILCTKQKGYLISKKIIGEEQQGRKRYISLKAKLHTVHEMYPIYHPSLLREYLIFGDITKLRMILLCLYDDLKKCEKEKSKEKMMRFLEIPVTVIFEKTQEEKKSITQPLKDSGIFANFMEEDVKSPPAEKIMNDTHKEEEELERLIRVKDELIEMIQTSPCLFLNEGERKELISFIANLKEFLAYQKAEDEILQEFLLHMNVHNVYWSLGQQIHIATMDIVLAYHCQIQDFLLKLLIDPIGNYCWEDIKRFGIPLWLKDSRRLKEIIEQVAIEEYKRCKLQDMDRVNTVSLWYIILRKKNVLSNLYKNTRKGNKVYEFLTHDFSEKRWKSAALNNGYKLLSQKQYVMAASFYLLGGWINEAIQVITTYLHDLYLAVTICRLLEEEGEVELKRIYKEYYIEKGIACGDPWIASLGNWLCGNYIEALNCIDYVLSREEPSFSDDMAPQLNLFCKEDSMRSKEMANDWIFESPSLSTFNASMIVLCRKLEKHYLVQCDNLIDNKRIEEGNQAGC